MTIAGTTPRRRRDRRAPPTRPPRGVDATPPHRYEPTEFSDWEEWNCDTAAEEGVPCELLTASGYNCNGCSKCEDQANEDQAMDQAKEDQATDQAKEKRRLAAADAGGEDERLASAADRRSLAAADVVGDDLHCPESFAASCADVADCFAHEEDGGGCAVEGDFLDAECLLDRVSFCRPCFPGSRCGEADPVYEPDETFVHGPDCGEGTFDGCANCRVCFGHGPDRGTCPAPRS